MANDFHKLDRIPAEQLTAYERWELPVMDEPDNEPPAISEEVVEEDIEITPLTAEELEEIRQAAYQEGQQEGRQDGFQVGREEGFREGREAGYAEGLSAGRATGEQQGADSKRAEIDEALKRLEGVTAELMDPIRHQQDEVEQALLNLVLAVSRSVIRREVSLGSQQIRQVVQEALEALPRGSDQIRLRVNPQDAPLVREMASQQQEPWVIQESAEVLPGGCKVESRYSLIDYTIEKRFQLAVRQMLERQLAGQPSPDSAEPGEIMEDLTSFQRELLDAPLPERTSMPEQAALPERTSMLEQAALPEQAPAPEQTHFSEPASQPDAISAPVSPDNSAQPSADEGMGDFPPSELSRDSDDPR